MAINLGSGFFSVAMQDNLSGPMGKLQKKLGISSRQIAAAATAAVAVVAGALAKAIFDYAKAGDEVQKLALKTGFTTEALSELRHAAELSGSSLEGIGKAVKRMAKFLEDGKDGLQTTTRDLEKLGFTVEEFKGLSPEEVFFKFANAIADLEDPLQRVAIAQNVFGRAGTDLLPMLAQGSEGMAQMRQEARDLGIVFDQEAANKAAKFNDDLLRLNKALQGVSFQIADVLIDDVIEFIVVLKDAILATAMWTKENKPLIRSIIDISLGISRVAFQMNPLIIAFKVFRTVTKAISDFFKQDFSPVLDTITAKIRGLVNTLLSLPGEIIDGLLALAGFSPRFGIGAPGLSSRSSAATAASSGGGGLSGSGGGGGLTINGPLITGVTLHTNADIDTLLSLLSDALKGKLVAAGQSSEGL